MTTQTASVTETISGPNDLPSFSIVIETENLSLAELDGLAECLEALQRQTVPVAGALEVLVGDSGNVPQETLDELKGRFPWITYYPVKPGIGYYAAKMTGLERTTGEVVLFCDSDCIYEPQWLENMLRPFADEKVEMVAGETTTPADGLYGIALAATYLFPRFSQGERMYASRGYHCNNVAFRRGFLLKYPIPTTLSLYRGNCVVHARRIMADGHTIWKQPLSRATHALPEDGSHFFWRFIWLGHDAVCIARLQERGGGDALEGELAGDVSRGARVLGSKLVDSGRRFAATVAERPVRIVGSLLALPITVASLALFSAGVAFAVLRPSYLMRRHALAEAAG